MAASAELIIRATTEKAQAALADAQAALSRIELRIRARSRSWFVQLIELSGLASIVYGVATVDRAAGLIVGGVLAVLAAYALERR